MQSDDFRSDLMTEKEAANYLTVSESSLRSIVQGGLINKIQVGKRGMRYHRSDLDSYIEEQRKGDRS